MAGDAYVAKIDFNTSAAIRVGCITNAASLNSDAISPGEIISIWGVGIGPDGGAGGRLDSSGRLATDIAGTQVFFDGVAAPLLYASTNQINAVAPYEVSANSVTHVKVQYQGNQSAAISVPVVATHPAIFTMDSSGKGQGAILNEDGTNNSPTQPAARGSVIVVFATGVGQTDPPGQDGKLNKDPLPKPLEPVNVYIYGKKTEILYAGAAPGFVSGAMQINARVPEDIPAGSAIPVWLLVGDLLTGGVLQEGVTVAIK